MQPARTFGRIPPETAALMQRTVGILEDLLNEALPGGATPELRAAALEVILGIVLRDWRENGNTDGLIDADVADLRSFVQFSAQAADGVRADDRPSVFVSVLRGLMEDWLANWNAPGDPGPPGPIN